MHINVDDSIKTIIFFVSFLTILLTMVMCCSSNRKKTELRQDDENPGEASAAEGAKENNGGGEVENTRTQAAMTGRTERTEEAKTQIASKANKPPTETVGRKDYATMRDIDNKLESSQRRAATASKTNLKPELKGDYLDIGPGAKPTVGGGGVGQGNYMDIGPRKDNGGGGTKVDSKLYGTMAAAGNLNPTIGGRKKGNQGADKVGSKLYGTMATAQTKALNPSVAKGKTKRAKTMVDANLYGTMQVANPNALNASKMTRGGRKGGGKVDANLYGTMQVANPYALAASKIAKNPGGKRGDCRQEYVQKQDQENYGTLFGVGKKMTASKC